MTTPALSYRSSLPRRGLIGLTLLATVLGIGIVAPPPASAATYTVNATDDVDDEVCDVTHCSLREAINASNDDIGADTIDFDIPGDEPHTIQLTDQATVQQALPPLWRTVTIDATTQDGYVDTPVVELVGEGVDGGQTAFTISAANVQVSGFSVRNFGEGVRLEAGASGGQILDNQFGTNLEGSAASGTQMNFAVGALAGAGHTIDGNLIANASSGIFFDGGTTDNAVINGNWIGLTRDGTAGLPVTQGITLDGGGFSPDVTNNVIGGHAASDAGISTTGTGGVTISGNSIGNPAGNDIPGRVSGGVVIGPNSTNLSVANNDIANGTGPGIRVNATASVAGTIFNNVIHDNDGDGIEITGNAMNAIVSQSDLFDNGGLGIDVGADGVDQFPDPAGLQLTAVNPGAEGTASVELEYDGLLAWANDPTSVEFALNAECDPSGFGEAQSHLASLPVNLDANGDLSGVFDVDFDIANGDIITAQIPGHGETGSATELSNCVDTAGGGGGEADLAITMTDTPDPVTDGGSVAYIATVENLGPDPATNPSVTFRDPGTGVLPAGTWFSYGEATSSGEDTGVCSTDEGGAVNCTLDHTSDEEVWTITVVLNTGPQEEIAELGGSPEEIIILDMEAEVYADQTDPNLVNNVATEQTTLEPAGEDEASTYIPPDTEEPTLLVTSETVTVNGKPIPAAQPDDTVAGAMVVPAGGPGGTATVEEFPCEAPFCAAPAAGTNARAPSTPPVEDRIVQYIPPFDPYYDYQNPLRYRIYYDVSVLDGLLPRDAKVFYTKDSDPETLLRARRCDEVLTAASTFPCVKSKNIVQRQNPALSGDLRLVLLGTYNDPRAAGFR